MCLEQFPSFPLHTCLRSVARYFWLGQYPTRASALPRTMPELFCLCLCSKQKTKRPAIYLTSPPSRDTLLHLVQVCSFACSYSLETRAFIVGMTWRDPKESHTAHPLVKRFKHINTYLSETCSRKSHIRHSHQKKSPQLQNNHNKSGLLILDFFTSKLSISKVQDATTKYGDNPHKRKCCMTIHNNGALIKSGHVPSFFNLSDYSKR